jgi:hypothetical protein
LDELRLREISAVFSMFTMAEIDFGFPSWETDPRIMLALVSEPPRSVAELR